LPQSAAPANSSTNGFDPGRVVLALVGVLGLIVLLRVGLRRIFPGAIPHRATRAIKILSRSIVSPKQHLLLIQVGKRLLVVGDSGAQLNPLCEITNEEESAAILAQVREESATAARRFDLLFGRARKGFDEDHAPPQQPIESPAEAVFDPSHEINDGALSETQNELVGLSDKVRDLARQLRSD
jgi:flagellar biogenesis protein FliO